MNASIEFIFEMVAEWSSLACRYRATDTARHKRAKEFYTPVTCISLRKHFGQLEFRISVCSKFQWTITLVLMLMVGKIRFISS